MRAVHTLGLSGDVATSRRAVAHSESRGISDVSIINVSSASTLMQALKVAQAGDTIALQSGTYAAVNLSNLKFAQDVVITSADPGKPAILTSMTVSESEGLTFRNLEFEVDPAADFYSFRVSGSKDIHFDELDVHGTLNGTPSGDITAFLIRDSEDVSITNSEFQQLFTGVSALSSKGLTFSNNEFHDIRSDGIQGGGNSNVVVTNNKFWDFFPEDGDHPDAIQFWTTKTTASAENYVISGNIISRGAGEAIQGIFLRDESGGKFPYLNVKITDNLLIGVSWNGITLNGRGGEIGGNTLISYADRASRVRLEFSEGINVHDNSAGGYVYVSNVNTQTTANGTTGAVSDAGASALAKWMSAHPGIVVGIGSSASPPVIEKPVPPITPPVEGGANHLTPVGSNIDGLNLVADASGRTLKGSARNDQLQGAGGADRLEGGAGNDLLNGAGGSDTLFGGAGDDHMLGGAGNDVLYGEAGDDYMDGGAGDDLLRGGDGVNVLIGGSGNDTYMVSNLSDIVVELEGGGDDLVWSSADFVLPNHVETLRLTDSAVSGSGNAGDNLIVGNAADNLLRGFDGNDRLDGGEGRDALDGGAGADTLYGRTGNDVLLGGSGDDNLSGDAADDYMDGGAGNDLFYGGAGTDTMIGGSGKDTFIFKTGDFAGGVNASMDVIRDFSSADGDMLHLVDLDANILTATNDAFKFIGTSQFHRVAGELRYEVAGDSAYVMGDVNGDGVADLKIQLVGVGALKAGDFFL